MERKTVSALAIFALLTVTACGVDGPPRTPVPNKLPPRGVGIDLTGETGSGIRLSGEASFGVSF